MLILALQDMTYYEDPLGSFPGVGTAYQSDLLARTVVTVNIILQFRRIDDYRLINYIDIFLAVKRGDLDLIADLNVYELIEEHSLNTHVMSQKTAVSLFSRKHRGLMMSDSVP